MIDVTQARRDDLHTDLLDRVADGDYTAFATLYFDLYRPVQRYAQMLLTDAADAQDVAAAVFVEIWHSARAYRRQDTEGQTVLRWAMMITRRRCLKRPKPLPQDVLSHMTVVSHDKHLKCQLGLLLAAGGARQTDTCRCMEG
ncbi:MAG TPA: sigma factor [Candidatus Limnocylindrales bacterium]|nr:sigma factor [Candidatus Limnocylindrales bacterium]